MPIVILGYIFALLGGWIGIILGIVAKRRPDPAVSRHGTPIIVLSIVMAIVWLALIA